MLDYEFSNLKNHIIQRLLLVKSVQFHRFSWSVFSPVSTHVETYGVTLCIKSKTRKNLLCKRCHGK